MIKRQSYDAIVVGAGVIGLSCAWRIGERGGRVLVLDRADPPAGATRVAAGMLAPVGELAFGEPDLLEMTLASAALYPDFIAALERSSGAETGYSRRGALHIALDRDEAAALRRIHDLQRSLGLGAEWLPPRRCREMEPALTPSLYGGVHAPGEATVDPRALSSALLAALSAQGTELRSDADLAEPITFGERLGGVRMVGGEELLCQTLVLATGAWSGVAAWLPRHMRPPIRPVKGQIVELRTPDKAVPCRRILASERVYLVPRDDGRLIVGATVEERGFETTPTAGGLHQLLQEAYRLLPDVAEMELVEVSAGLRPASPDNLPVVGAGVFDGLILATGHYRNGILLAPITAAAVAELLDGGSLPQALAAADPSRFAAITAGVSG